VEKTIFWLRKNNMTLTPSDYTLKKGDEAPDFSLLSTSRKQATLNELKGEKATLIVFMCNHCPYVLAKLPELNRIYQDFKDKGLQIIGINSNDPTTYPEDNFENMRSLVNSGEINFPYLQDESQEVARSYNAACTPDPFLFDENLKLIFHSRIDDPPNLNQAKAHELHEAINEFLLSGKITKYNESPSMGCNIKWK
tara:strand:- start:10801 stop:11388 length:588 start_codon:yes stop_codon:yes gene_type:complete